MQSIAIENWVRETVYYVYLSCFPEGVQHGMRRHIRAVQDTLGGEEIHERASAILEEEPWLKGNTEAWKFTLQWVSLEVSFRAPEYIRIVCDFSKWKKAEFKAIEMLCVKEAPYEKSVILFQLRDDPELKDTLMRIPVRELTTSMYTEKVLRVIHIVLSMEMAKKINVKPF